MKPTYFINFMMGMYIFIFFAYLFGPLIVMSITAFNSAEFHLYLLGNVLALDGLMRERLPTMVSDLRA